MITLQEEAQNQRDETFNAVGGDLVPDNQEDAQAKKNGFMNKLRTTRVSPNITCCS